MSQMKLSTSTVLTSEGAELLSERIRQIRNVTIPSYRELLSEPERDERIVAEFERLQGEIERLEALLAHSTVIDPTKARRDGVVRLGSRVLIQTPDGKEYVRVVDIAEAFLDDERISSDSPLSRSLLGARVDEFVEVVAPRGVWTARILEVDGKRRGRIR